MTSSYVINQCFEENGKIHVCHVQKKGGYTQGIVTMFGRGRNYIFTGVSTINDI